MKLSEKECLDLQLIMDYSGDDWPGIIESVGLTREDIAYEMVEAILCNELALNEAPHIIKTLGLCEEEILPSVRNLCGQGLKKEALEIANGLGLSIEDVRSSRSSLFDGPDELRDLLPEVVSFGHALAFLLLMRDELMCSTSQELVEGLGVSMAPSEFCDIAREQYRDWIVDLGYEVYDKLNSLMALGAFEIPADSIAPFSGKLDPTQVDAVMRLDRRLDPNSKYYLSVMCFYMYQLPTEVALLDELDLDQNILPLRSIFTSVFRFPQLLDLVPDRAIYIAEKLLDQWDKIVDAQHAIIMARLERSPSAVFYDFDMAESFAWIKAGVQLSRGLQASGRKRKLLLDRCGQSLWKLKHFIAGRGTWEFFTPEGGLRYLTEDACLVDIVEFLAPFERVSSPSSDLVVLRGRGTYYVVNLPSHPHLATDTGPEARQSYSKDPWLHITTNIGKTEPASLGTVARAVEWCSTIHLFPSLAGILHALFPSFRVPEIRRMLKNIRGLVSPPASALGQLVTASIILGYGREQADGLPGESLAELARDLGLLLVPAR